MGASSNHLVYIVECLIVPCFRYARTVAAPFNACPTLSLTCRFNTILLLDEQAHKHGL